MIFVLGCLAFAVATAGGVLFAKFMNLVSKNKMNPLIGAAVAKAEVMSSSVGLWTRKCAASLVQVTIAGAPANAGTAAMISAARSPRFMGRAIAVVDSDAARQHLATQIPFVEQAAAPGDPPRAWVCINRSCRDPVDSPEALQATLETALAG